MTRGDDRLVPAGFFLLRTPLLPLDTLASWSEGLAVPAARDDELEAAVAADRRLLRARLRELIEVPAVREALASASGSLLDGLTAWHDAPESEAGQKVERALVRYVARMASRPTPFQLLAGVSVGEIAARTAIRLAPRDAYHRRTRLEAAHVHALAGALAAEPDVAAGLRYRASTGLYVLHHEVRWYEPRVQGGMRAWAPARLRRSATLDAILARAAGGASARELDEAARAADPEGPALVAQLIARGALVHDLEPPVTGDEPLAWLAHRLRDVAPARGRALDDAARSLAALDDAPLGSAREPAPPPAAVRLGDHAPPLQIDLVKPVEEATLASRVAGELAAAVEALARLAPRAPDPLARLREAYARRFDDLETPRFVPLAELVDPDGGVGLDGPQGPHAGWIAEVDIPVPGATPPVTWGARERFLLAKLTAAAATGAREIALARDELEALAPAPALPESLSVIAAVATTPGHADDFRVLVHHARAGATRLLARFAELAEVRPHVAELVRAEAARHPGAVLAEVVHFPAGPADLMGALHHRPVLREHEIPLLARSGAPADHQLPPDDLLVSVGRTRTTLWSRRLGRRVLPRLASAHRVEFRKGHHPAYRLLFAIENEGLASPYLEWSWGPLAAPFLPRVTFGRAVLALAEWQLGATDVAALDQPTPARRMAAVRRLRERLALPRVVSLVDVERPTFDNVLHLDLDHALAVDAFVHAATTAGRARLREPFAAPEELIATGPEGRFAHELVVPFARAHVAAEAEPVVRPPATRHAFPPGGEWMTLRIEAGMGRFDHLLVDRLVPIVREALATGDADRWFFLRLGLPVPQLRLRLHGEPAQLARPRARLESLLAELVARGEVFRAEWTTYEREVERYGGDEGIAIAERIFEADSEAVVAVIAGLPDPADELARERITLVGVDRLLDDLGLHVGDKLAVLDALCERWRAELSVDPALDIRLGATFRRERAALERLLAGEDSAHAWLAPIWARRAGAVRSLAGELQQALQAGRLSLDVPAMAQSFAHMHAIRLAIRHSRIHELVVYDFLRRLYRSQVARSRNA